MNKNEKKKNSEKKSITCNKSVAAFISSFLAAICKAGKRTFPLVSFSSNNATTRSCPCCKATANGVKPS